MDTVLDRQTKAVLREYREALDDENFTLAHRIWTANPDLHKALLQVNDEWQEEVDTQDLGFDASFDEAWDALQSALARERGYE